MRHVDLLPDCMTGQTCCADRVYAACSNCYRYSLRTASSQVILAEVRRTAISRKPLNLL
jgi:hypothetical protein